MHQPTQHKGAALAELIRISPFNLALRTSTTTAKSNESDIHETCSVFALSCLRQQNRHVMLTTACLIVQASHVVPVA
jgi:hypothetical protein